MHTIMISIYIFVFNEERKFKKNNRIALIYENPAGKTI